MVVTHAAFAACCNVQEVDCQRMVDVAVEKFGGLHVAFNNAGTSKIVKFAEITEDVMSGMLDVNFKSLVYCFKYQVRQLHDLSGCVNAEQCDFANESIFVAA